MNSYYCVKENLCEVMFSVIRTPKLFPKREHYIRRYYTPPLTTLILPATVQLGTPWMSLSLHPRSSDCECAEIKTKVPTYKET